MDYQLNKTRDGSFVDQWSLPARNEYGLPELSVCEI
jgi:hypothetical protein